MTKQGLATLLDATAELLDKTPEFLLYDESDMEEEAYYGFDEEEKAFEISRDDDATWVLSGEKLMKLFNMTNFDRDESVMKFARQLSWYGGLMKPFVRVVLKMGIWSALVNLSLNL